MLTSPAVVDLFGSVVLLGPRGELLGSLPACDDEAQKQNNHRRALLLHECDERFPETMHLEKERRYPDRISRVEDPDSNGEGIARLIGDDRRRIDFIVDLVAKRIKGPAAEIGCSQGVISLRLAQATRRQITGTDIRPEAIEEARKLLKLKYQTSRDNCRFLSDKDFWAESRSFETILLLEVLEHLQPAQQQHLLRRAVGMLDLAGTLYVSVPNRFPDPEYEEEGRHRWDAPAHVTFFNLPTLTSLLGMFFKKVEPVAPDGDGIDSGIWLHLICKEKK